MSAHVNRSGIRLVLGLALVCAGLFLCSACAGSEEGSAPASSAALGEIDRLVLVTFDTLRADHVSAYGYPLATTPFLDSMAESGVQFRRAFAHSAATKPSHSSIFTSLYPLQHRVRSNALVLDEEFVTLAEILRDGGYKTAAFLSIDAPVGGQLGQGFETYDVEERDLTVDGARKEYRHAGETIDAALAWLETVDPDELLFLWIHVYDPHKPLRPPAGHFATISVEIERFGPQNFRELLQSQGIGPLSDRAVADVVDYDAEVHYADAEVGRLYREMEAMGLQEETLWVLTSDHGQGLGSHGWFGHGKQIYNSQLQVPLIFHTPDGTLAPRLIETQVAEHVDLLPTIVELLGVPEAGTAAVAQPLPMQGSSLVPFLLGRRHDAPKWFSFGERSRYIDDKPRQQDRPNYEGGFRYSLQDREYKYLLFTEGPDEFYDLLADPYEEHNLIDSFEHADKRDQMSSVLADMVASLTSEGQATSVSAEDVERLRSLGYIQ